MRKILNVYLARANTPYSEAYADLDLPASPYELLDALDKLRLDEGEAPYLQINEYYDFEDLAPLLSGNVGLYELNALAQKLSELDERQQVSFKGLVQMEVNKKQGLIPISRLIDLAYSTDCCHVRLRDLLLGIQGKFLLSYNDDEFIRELYDAPEIQILSTTRINNIKQRYDPNSQFAELLIGNYDLGERARCEPSQMTLFDYGQKTENDYTEDAL